MLTSVLVVLNVTHRFVFKMMRCHRSIKIVIAMWLLEKKRKLCFREANEH